MLNRQQKKDPSDSAIKTLAATLFAQRMKAAYTKKQQPRGNLQNNLILAAKKHGKLAKMRVVKNLLKSNYGRPFFVCSDQANPCSFWV